MRLAIVQVGEPVLRQAGRSLTPAEIVSPEVQQLIELMRETMRQARREFSNMEWLSEEWVGLNDRQLSEQDMDVLLQHFGTDIDGDGRIG